MLEKPLWIPESPSQSLIEWTQYLKKMAYEQFTRDGSHVNVLFLFKKNEGIASVDSAPPGIDHEQLTHAIIDAVEEHDLYGVIVIGEVWSYQIKEKDHTSFQILDGEMRVSDLNSQDKNEALMIRMESRDGDSLIYISPIHRNKTSSTLGNETLIQTNPQKWF